MPRPKKVKETKQEEVMGESNGGKYSARTYTREDGETVIEVKLPNGEIITTIS